MPWVPGFPEAFDRASRIPVRVVGTLAMSWAAIGCSEAPTVVARGDAMPVGDFEVRVVRVATQAADRTAPSAYEGKYVIAVSLACSGGSRSDRMDLKDKLFDTEAVGIVDVNDRRGLLLGVNWDESYETLTFRLFAHEETGLTLLLDNPARTADQPHRFVVPLE